MSKSMKSLFICKISSARSKRTSISSKKWTIKFQKKARCIDLLVII